MIQDLLATLNDPDLLRAEDDGMPPVSAVSIDPIRDLICNRLILPVCPPDDATFASLGIEWSIGVELAIEAEEKFELGLDSDVFDRIIEGEITVGEFVAACKQEVKA
jgi:hypothetical protein